VALRVASRWERKEGKLGSALNEFRNTLVEAAEQRKRAHDATPVGMFRSADVVRQADTVASAEVCA
jgi:hypothetical protein